MSRNVTVFLVDDHDVVRRGLRALLEEAGGFRVVGEGASVPDALCGLLSTRPQVAVVDVRLPGGDGVQLVREIQARSPETRCLILTSFPDEQAFFQSVVAGAYGYVVKDVANRELVHAIRAVAEGHTLVKQEVIEDLRRRARALPPDDELLAGLTGQERKILELITEAKTNREIASELFLAEKTVRNYVSNVLSKLGMKNRTQVAAYVAHRTGRQRGYELSLAR